MSKKGQVVGPTGDLPPGSVTHLPIGKFGVGLYNVQGDYYAVTNYCPHRGGPLCRGVVTGTIEAGSAFHEVRWVRDGEILRCPWHGWEFDIRTGRSLAYPDKAIRMYPVSVEDGLVVVNA